MLLGYSPVISDGEPTEPHGGGDNALGAPDYDGVNACESQGVCTFVSLGDGGSVTVGFTDNLLAGSDDDTADLCIYEVGPDIEDTLVEISADNATWLPVGTIFGSTTTIDIDAFGHGSSSLFAYIRLTDDPNEGGQSERTVGADIDAVEALTSVPNGEDELPATGS
ncbi:MAG: hypothetical protein V4850_24750 [Myxococcota bacterium]